MFDAAEFLNTEITVTLDTEIIPCPADLFPATISKVELRQWKKKDDPSVGGLALDLIWEIQDEEVKRVCNREKVTVKQGLMLDLTDSGKLDTSAGRNISLGKLRDALNLNQSGQAFAFSMLEGRMAKVQVSHRAVDDSIFAEVKRVYPF